MANKGEQNKLLYFEPNLDNNTLISNEDISIFVELETTSKGRSIINLDGVNGEGKVFNKGGKSTTIRFIDGSTENGVNSLTTDYTNISSFNRTDEDIETLGIESIDIDFDTAYTPLVKIKFIDVRGKSIFEKGINSKYNVFFDLPYPIFSLTVKGYYGRPVKYCLHLLKWNAKFNSNTGNFEIDAEFIGYTYAILTDLLIGYLRAVVYTKDGSEIFNGIKKEYADKGIQIKTIDEFLKDIETIADEFEKIKNEDEEIKELNTSSLVRESIKTLRSRMASLISVLFPDGSNYFNDGRGVICVDPKKGEEQSVKASIDDFKKKIRTDLDDVETGLNSKIAVESLKFRTNNIVNFITVKDLSYSDFNDANVEVTGTEKLFQTNLYERDVDNEDSSVNDFVSELAITLNRNLPSDLNSNPSLLIYDFRKAFNEIDRVERALIDNEKDVREKIGLRLSKVASEKLNFDPNIRNIFRVLTVHCEVLLKTIAKVSKDAENSSSRTRILNRLKGNSTQTFNIKEGDNKIYPWPEFRLRENRNGGLGNFEESWIGGRGAVSNRNDQNKVAEIVFVEDLLEQLLKVAQQDIDAEITNGEVLGPQFYPVSSLDTRFSSNLNDNPYKAALIDGMSRGISEEATRCLILRGFLGLGVANKDLPTSLIQSMGDLEAYNLFDAIKSNFSTSNARPLLTQINSGGDVTTKVNNLINVWKNGVDETIVKNPFNKKTPIFVDGPDNTYLYTYITDSPTASEDLTYGRAYIPISSNFDGRRFYNTNGDDITMKDNSELNSLSSSVTFVGNNFGNELNKTDNLDEITDGSTYMKIISPTNYDNGLNSPDFGKELLEVYRKSIPEGTLLRQSFMANATYNETFLVQMDPYSGRYKTQEIFDMVYDVNSSSFNTTGESVIYNKANKRQEREGSILSSYWSQRDYSKEYAGGTYLAKGRETKETTNQFCVGCGRGKFNLNEDRILPREFGKQRELLGELIGEVNVSLAGDEFIYTPFIEYGIANHEDNTLNYFSLFGSQFYYKQTSDEAKALLFLHSFGWQGLIGDIKDNLSKLGDTTNVSLFDTIKDNGDSFKSDDDTPTIKSLFKNNSAFIKAPKLWCAFIGGVLHRYHEGLRTGDDLIYFGHDNGSFEQIFPWQDSSSYVPNFDEYLYDIRSQSPFGINFVFDSGDVVRNDGASSQRYAKIDETLLNLPPQVKLEFIGIFKEFVENDFFNINRELEVWDGSSSKTYEETWSELDNAKFADFNVVNTSTIPQFISNNDIRQIFSDTNVTRSYKNISPASNEEWDDVNIYQYNLEIKPNSRVTNLINNLISQSYVIMNAVPRSFNQNESTPSTKYGMITVDRNKLNLYLTSFFNRFEKLVDNFEKGVNDDTDDLEQKVFKTMNDDLIKLNIYRSLGSLYNKWIAGTDNILGQCGVSPNDKKISISERGSNEPRLIDSFRFLDRAFNDIGDRFYINPIAILNLVRGKYNQSFFDLTNRILSDNNFNFIALPSFLNFREVSQLEEMFTPFAYNDLVDEDYNVGPSFVCTYVGQTSTNLDLGENSTYPDDGITIRFDENGQIYDAPEDFTNVNDNPRDLNIPMVGVSYGKQNQSYFKDIRLDQREFAETAESLEIIEDISQSGDKRKPTSAGQNLFNVYQTRSYSAEIEMMGNAMMQPMMYFQLNNIPMFRGAYLITKVTHHLKANSMMTKFKGVRVKRPKTKLIDSPTLFMELLGSLKGLGNAEQIGGSTDTGPIDKTGTIVPNRPGNNINGIIIEA